MSENETTPAAVPVFSASKKFVVPILSGTRKVCSVAFPTNQQWCDRARKQRSIRRFLGRGKSEAEAVDTSTADLELFNRIRKDEGGDAFDAAEAAVVIGKLERASVESCEREGDLFRIRLKVPGAVTEHLVGMPTQRQMDSFEAASVHVIGQRRSQEIRGFLEPSGELYDALKPQPTGYEGDVPIIHKAAVVGEVINQVAQEDEEPIPEA